MSFSYLEINKLRELVCFENKEKVAFVSYLRIRNAHAILKE